MRLIIRERESMISDLSVQDGIVLIGSHPACDIYLPDGRLAPRHVVIEPEGDAGWTVRPLDVSTPTTINRATLHSRHRLKNGDEIGFAEYSVRVYLDEAGGLTTRVTTPEHEQPQATRYPLPPDTAILNVSDVVALEAAGLMQLSQLPPVLRATDSAGEMITALAAWTASNLKADCAWACLATDPEHEPHLCGGTSASGPECKTPERKAMLIHRTVQRQQSLLLPTDPARYASALAAPLIGGPTVLGLIYAERGLGKPPFNKAHLALLRSIGSIAGVRMEELLGGQQQALKRQGEQQTIWAHRIQERLTPAILPSWDTLEIAAYRLAGKACCGDIYDVVRMPKGPAAFLLGHALAAGTEAALLMAEVRAAFRIALLHADAPHFVLKELNWLVYDTDAGHRMRCFAGLFDPDTGKLHYSVAGQPGAYLLKADGEVRGLIQREAPDLGIEAQVDYPAHGGQIVPGDSIVLFTRGLITAGNAQGEPFGLQRIMTALSDMADQDAHQIVQGLVDDLTGHLGGIQPGDDVTILVLRRTP